MTPPTPRRLALFLELTAVFGALAALLGGVAEAQALHGHEEGGSLNRLEVLTSLVQAVTLTSTVCLAGLAAFVALVWLPACRALGVNQDDYGLFGRGMWVLFGLLAVAGLVDLSLYSVDVSDQSFGLGIFMVSLYETAKGHVWLLRFLLALLTVLVAARAFAAEKLAYWWVAAGLGGVLLMTLTWLSHARSSAVTGSGFLPLVADWLHVVAASLWMGGLLAFPMLLLGPLRRMPADSRNKLLTRSVRRFTKVATVAVLTLLITGTYAILLHLPSFSALIGTEYGRALIMKLGLVAFVLPAGALNLIDRGQGPFGRMVGAELLLALGLFVATGFLTTLPPP